MTTSSPDLSDLTGRTAIITGANSGIGAGSNITWNSAGGTLRYFGTTVSSTNRSLTMTGGATPTIDASGTAAASSRHRSLKYIRTRPSELSSSNTVRQM